MTSHTGASASMLMNRTSLNRATVSVPDFTENFASDTWTQTDNAFVAIAGGVMTFDDDQADTGNGESNMGKDTCLTVSDTAFVLKLLDMNFDTVTQGASANSERFYWGMSDSISAGQGGTSDHIYLVARISTSVLKFTIVDGDGSNIDFTGDADFTAAPSVTTFKPKLRRTSATAYAIELNFGTPLEEQTGTVASTTDGLDFVRCNQRTGGGGHDHTFDGDTDDWEVYNGVTDA